MKYINKLFKTLVSLFLMLIAAIAYLPMLLLFPTKIYGKKNLRKLKGGAVIVCNHFSNLDAIILKVRLFISSFSYTFLGKIEMNRCRPLGWFLSCFGVVYINRQTLDRNAMKTVQSHLQAGKKVVIFPEGTRNKTGSTDLQAVKSGVIFFAKRACVPILPMRMARKPKLFRFNRLYIGEAYSVGDAGEMSTSEEVSRLAEKMNNLGK